LVGLAPGDEDNAEDDCHDGGDHVVGDGAAADLSRKGEVEVADGHDEGGDDERDDDAFEHLETGGYSFTGVNVMITIFSDFDLHMFAKNIGHFS
jgi:hypothetical protein